MSSGIALGLVHCLAFAALCLYHVGMRWLIGVPSSDRKQLNETIWAGIAVGSAGSALWILRNTLPWGRITPQTFFGLASVQHLFIIYGQALAVLTAYYACSNLATGNRSSWWWTLTHVVVMPAFAAHVWFNLYLSGRLAPASLLVRCMALTLRYQVWLAIDSVLSLLMRIDESELNADTIQRRLFLYGSYAYALYWITLTLCDHQDLFPRATYLINTWWPRSW